MALCKNKVYLLPLVLTAVLAYGFMVTHPAVGIDDTPYAYYFQEGLAAIVGRWVLYLLNKVFLVFCSAGHGFGGGIDLYGGGDGMGGFVPDCINGKGSGVGIPLFCGCLFILPVDQ